MNPFIEKMKSLSVPSEVSLSQRQLNQMATHFELMSKWNKTHNLTRIVDAEVAAEKHYLDCLMGLTWVPEDFTAHDFGSGAGFPGMVAAIARPHQQFVLVEPARKRASFLDRAIKAMGLMNAQVANCRAQDMNNLELVISRGTFSWPNFEPFVQSLRLGGQLALWLGHTPNETEFREGMKDVGLEPQWFSYELPESGQRYMGRAVRIANSFSAENP